MQSPKNGQNDMRVAPSYYGKGHKKAQQVEYDAIRYVIRELLINGIVPTVLVLLNGSSQVAMGCITIYQGYLMAQVANTACIGASPGRSCHMTSLSKPEDRAGQSENHNPNQDTGALDSLLGLQCDDFHGVADT